MMKNFLTENPRFNEPIGFLFLFLAIGLGLSLTSYSPLDPSFSVASADETARNLVGLPGSYVADLLLQLFGVAAFLLPVGLTVVGWRWLRSITTVDPWTRLIGISILGSVACCALSLIPSGVVWQGTIQPGGVVGSILAESSLAFLNLGGTLLLLLAASALSFYLLTTLHLTAVLEQLRAAKEQYSIASLLWKTWRLRFASPGSSSARKPSSAQVDVREGLPALAKAAAAATADDVAGDEDLPPIIPYESPAAASTSAAELENLERGLDSDGASKEYGSESPPWDDDPTAPDSGDDIEDLPEPVHYTIPTTALLNPPFERGVYDPNHLHEVSRQIVSKFDEFGVKGLVSQINPGPVVTTFEFKPDRGVKISKITNLSEDLCLALECESILVERTPGKSTVGIEVPNKHREIIGLKEVLDSPDFRDSKSILTVALGKDINGKIHVADLTKMPHVLVAGSTGAGKSVLINCLIMSILLRATPDDVRFIMIDPKTVELGLYHDIPHLLTPVITDMKKATNALKNATREMERRLKLLAEHGVRNIDQFNQKIEQLQQRFERRNPDLSTELKKLPYIVVIVDELADLMMLEGRAVEESITRLAQMARAVGIHLVLATQRPSVDVITGLIKANVPARISFRLATRVDSRTILDSMGAESLLGRGDMLYLPPGTARMRRLHGPWVTEDETQAVVSAWKEQCRPDYEIEYLATPDDEGDGSREDAEGFDDPIYEEAVRLVLEQGKASTSTLQRRLRLGYGRAARVLDAMERDGIIGPTDGSRAREVLKRPDWLAEVENR
jgi:S-DNA-T family DNA segregation ATPase FtsK/SpoIIIE